MKNIKAFALNNRLYIYMFMLWGVLWIVPWGRIAISGNLYLTFFVGMVKLGIALVVFILPGALLYLLVRNEYKTLVSLWGILPVGFALSVSIIAMIGIVGRLFGLSFISVRNIFALVGVCELILLAYTKPNSIQFKYVLKELLHANFINIPFVFAVILATSMAFNGYQFFIDDTTYAAYVTNWENSTHLGFGNIVHQTGAVEQARFWLALYPMGQALLSNLSGVPSILLFSNYLELFLVPLAVVTAYWFACCLGFSQRAAGFSVLLQVFFYSMMNDESWPVGFWFFQNMIEDKVSAVFLISPVFIFLVLTYLQFPTKKNISLVILCGAGLMLTHPVILFLTGVIAAGLTALAWIMKKTSQRYVVYLFFILVIAMLPYVGIRYFARSSQGIPYDAESVSSTFQAERYVNVINNVYYGLNPDVLKLANIAPAGGFYSIFQIVRFIPIGLVFSAAILALPKLRSGVLAWYILITVLLIIFATIPYTGWLLGYFISARMLPRVSWYLPLGISGVFVVNSIAVLLKSPFVKFNKSYVNKETNSEEIVKKSLSLLVFGFILFASVILPRTSVFFEILNHNVQLSQIGTYIDKNTDNVSVAIALDYIDVQLLPSVSSRISLISFREEKDYNPHNYFMSIDDVRDRMNASNKIRSLDLSAPVAERCAFLNQYNVEYVLVRTDTAGAFMSLTSTCGAEFLTAYKTVDLILLERR